MGYSNGNFNSDDAIDADDHALIDFINNNLQGGHRRDSLA
jgi:hypothetical protein